MWKIVQVFLLRIHKKMLIKIKINENSYSVFWCNTPILADSSIFNTIKTTSRFCNPGKAHFCKLCDFFLVHSHKLGAKTSIFKQRWLKLPTIKSLLTKFQVRERAWNTTLKDRGKLLDSESHWNKLKSPELWDSAPLIFNQNLLQWELQDFDFTLSGMASAPWTSACQVSLYSGVYILMAEGISVQNTEC